MSQHSEKFKYRNDLCLINYLLLAATSETTRTILIKFWKYILSNTEIIFILVPTLGNSKYRSNLCFINFNYFVMKLVELANFNETFLDVSWDGDYIYVRLKIQEIVYIATTCV